MWLFSGERATTPSSPLAPPTAQATASLAFVALPRGGGVAVTRRMRDLARGPKLVLDLDLAVVRNRLRVQRGPQRCLTQGAADFQSAVRGAKALTGLTDAGLFAGSRGWTVVTRTCLKGSPLLSFLDCSAPAPWVAKW
jgi:hypothetical protein